jgi:ABC-type sugar transport system substrate-binding protein
MKYGHLKSFWRELVLFSVAFLALGVMVMVAIYAPKVKTLEAKVAELQNVAPPVPVVVGTDFSKYQKGLPFRFIGTNREVPVVKIMIAGFLQACADYGLKCELMTVDGNDIAKSVTLAEQSVALGSSGILSTIYDKAWYKPTADAIAAGIPVVNGHFPMGTDVLPGLTAWSAPDNVGYAINAADATAAKIGCKGVVAVTQSSLNDGENAVALAFTNEMAVKCPGLKVLESQLETTDPVKAMGVTGAIIQANPELTAGFSTTGGGIVAWTTAAKEAGKKAGELVIVGMDASAENIAKVDNGEAYALVAQPLYQEMYHAVVLLLSTAMGQAVPYENVLPAPLVFQGQTGPYLEIIKRAEAIK